MKGSIERLRPFCNDIGLIPIETVFRTPLGSATPHPQHGGIVIQLHSEIYVT